MTVESMTSGASATAADETNAETQLLKSTRDIVCAYLENKQDGGKDIHSLIEEVYGTLSRLQQSTAENDNAYAYMPHLLTPAVPVEDSIQEDHIVCLEDGKKLKMLKRYLMTNYGLTPEQYRRKWGLPATYPMTAPSYSVRRSELAKDIGLGKK